MQRAEDEVVHDVSVLRVEELRDGQTFAALRPEWDALMERSAAASFNRWGWLYPWWRRIGSEREPRLLTARAQDGRLVGLMPLCLEDRGGIRRLCFLGENHVGSDYLDIVAELGREAEIAMLFAQQLRQKTAEWDVLDLLDLESGSLTLKALSDTFAGAFEVEQRACFVCPGEGFADGEGFDAFLARTARKENYLRRRKWLEKQSGFRINVARSPTELARPLSEFFRLHALRWQGAGGSEGIKGPSVEAFHRDATFLLAESGLLRLYTLEVAGAAVASVYGILDRQVFSYYQSGYDPAWASKSVGLVLVGETFRDALASGATRYDFLRGSEGYKSDWTQGQRQTVALRIYAPGTRGAALTRDELRAQQLREALKRLLPSDAVEQVRRFRRRRAAI